MTTGNNSPASNASGSVRQRSWGKAFEDALAEYNADPPLSPVEEVASPVEDLRNWRYCLLPSLVADLVWHSSRECLIDPTHT